MKIEAPVLSSLPGIVHGFFTREGGVSEGLYASLNAGLGSDDKRVHVEENRARIAKNLGLEAASLLTLYQVHSAEPVMAERPWQGTPPKADALVTLTPGLGLGALAADCAPVLFADAEARVVAAAHAGWKGALKGILENTVSAMEAAGAQRHRIHAAIGPCISQAAYEVGAEFRDRFLAADRSYERFFTQEDAGGHCHFDLAGFVTARCTGLELAAVEALGHCTYRDERRFYSYRRATHRGERDYGRQISVIALKA